MLLLVLHADRSNYVLEPTELASFPGPPEVHSDILMRVRCMQFWEHSASVCRPLQWQAIVICDVGTQVCVCG